MAKVKRKLKLAEKIKTGKEKPPVSKYLKRKMQKAIGETE